MSGAVVFAGGADVGGGPLVTLAGGPAGKLELAGDDGSPVGRIEGMVALAGAVVPGPEVTGEVPFAALVAFAGGEAGPVALADVGAAPLSEGPGDGAGAVALPVGAGAVPFRDVGTGPLSDGPGEAVGAVALPVGAGAVPLRDVGAGPLSEGPGEALGAVPLPVGDGGRIPDAEVPLPGNGVGAVVLPGAGAVPFVGRGSAKVVEFSGTMTLVAVDAVAFVGTGETGAVEFNGAEPLVEAGADADALLGAASELGGGEPTPVPDGSGAGVVPLAVGKGGDVVDDPGSGGREVSPDGRGAKTVVELATMIRLVAAADPLMLMVVTPVMAPTDEIALIGTEVEDSLPEGSGATTVVELTGITTLVAEAVSLVTTVVRLPVMTPGGAVVPEIEGDDALPVGNGATSVVELRGTMTLVATAVPLTKTVETLPGILRLTVLLANGAEDGIPEALGENGGGPVGVTGGPSGEPELR